MLIEVIWITNLVNDVLLALCLYVEALVSYKSMHAKHAVFLLSKLLQWPCYHIDSTCGIHIITIGRRCLSKAVDGSTHAET